MNRRTGFLISVALQASIWRSLSSYSEVYGMDMSDQAVSICRGRGLRNLHQFDPEKEIKAGNPLS